VRVWRERKGWLGPFELIATDGENCTIALKDGTHSIFRSTSVKPYYEDEANTEHDPPIQPDEADEAIEADIPLNQRMKPSKRSLIASWLLLPEA